MSIPFPYGHLPPVPPASPTSSGNLTPFGGTDVGITVTWNFSCGHQFIQKKTNKLSFNSNQQKSSLAKCPECIEAEEDRHKEEREAARKAKEETLRKAQEKQDLEAKARRHDEEAINVYKKQVASFQLQINNAGDNVPLRESQEKMLRTCRLLWADIVRKIEILEEEMAPTEKMSKALSIERLEKVNLLVSRAEILHQQEQALFSPKPNHQKDVLSKKEVLAERLKAWKDISAMMESVVDRYDLEVSSRLIALEDFEKTWSNAWEDALKLMKEE